jgi:hypothetical protein
MKRFFRVWWDGIAVNEEVFLAEDAIRAVSITAGIWWVLTSDPKEEGPESAFQINRETAVALLGQAMVDEFDPMEGKKDART